MKIENRIKKLEKKIIVPDLPKCHLVIVDPGASEEQAIEKYKAENEVGPKDEIFVVRFVSPKEVKNESK